MKFYKTTILIFIVFFYSSCKTSQNIIAENVLGDKSLWALEQQPGGEVNFLKNKIEIIDNNGCTIWFKKQLEGNIKIEYDVTVIDAGGPLRSCFRQ